MAKRKTAETRVSKVFPAKSALTPEQLINEIRARAHQIFLARGHSSPGSDMSDWLDAEREIKTRFGIKQ